jgi:hypothetical protein
MKKNVLFRRAQLPESTLRGKYDTMEDSVRPSQSAVQLSAVLTERSGDWGDWRAGAGRRKLSFCFALGL